MKLAIFAAAVVLAAVTLLASPSNAAGAALPPGGGDSVSVPEPVTPLLVAAGVMIGLVHRPRRTRKATAPLGEQD